MSLAGPSKEHEEKFQEHLDALDAKTKVRRTAFERQCESADDAVTELAEAAEDTKIVKLPTGKFKIQRTEGD
jgi:hypothetical protein